MSAIRQLGKKKGSDKLHMRFEEGVSVTKKARRNALPRKKAEKEFEIVNGIIERHWNRAIGLANAESLMAYWIIGAFVSARLKKTQWGAKTVEELCDYLKTRNPKRRGFGKRQIYNMVQFYDTYTSPEYQAVSERLRLHEFVQLPTAQSTNGAIEHSVKAQTDNAGVVQSATAQLECATRECAPFPSFLSITTFTNHIEILNRVRSTEERVFYILYAARERLNQMELRRALASQTYEAIMSKEKKMSLKLKSSYSGADFLLKDKVFVDFLRLPEKHNEHRLHVGILEHMKEFILAMGKDFLYMGNEYSIEVGGKRRRLDLLFYHRALRCLVDVELKAVPFEPEFAGKMDFYLAAIDDQIKREGENPSVGVILCPEAGMCEVKYAIDRTMSPMMIAEYKRLLVPEEVMKKSLEEYCAFMKSEEVGKA